jgi:hypothetical protein
MDLKMKLTIVLFVMLSIIVISCNKKDDQYDIQKNMQILREKTYAIIDIPSPDILRKIENDYYSQIKKKCEEGGIIANNMNEVYNNFNSININYLWDKYNILEKGNRLDEITKELYFNLSEEERNDLKKLAQEYSSDITLIREEYYKIQNEYIEKYNKYKAEYTVIFDEYTQLSIEFKKFCEDVKKVHENTLHFSGLHPILPIPRFFSFPTIGVGGKHYLLTFKLWEAGHM